MVFRKRACMNCEGETPKDSIGQRVRGLRGGFIRCSDWRGEMIIVAHDGGVS